FRRTWLLRTETFPRSAQPLGFGLCMRERVSRTTVLHHHFAHHEIGIRVIALHLLRGDDKAEIADVAFDTAEAAVTVWIKVDFASARCDARVAQVHFEGDQFRF